MPFKRWVENRTGVQIWRSEALPSSVENQYYTRSNEQPVTPFGDINIVLSMSDFVRQLLAVSPRDNIHMISSVPFDDSGRPQSPE